MRNSYLFVQVNNLSTPIKVEKEPDKVDLNWIPFYLIYFIKCLTVQFSCAKGEL